MSLTRYQSKVSSRANPGRVRDPDRRLQFGATWQRLPSAKTPASLGLALGTIRPLPAPEATARHRAGARGLDQRAAGPLICSCIAVAADLDGTFAVVRMQPVSRGVQIAAVVAARPRGGFPCRPPRVCGGVGGPGLSTLVCRRPAGAVSPVGADGGGRLAVGGVAVQIGERLGDLWLRDCGPWSALPCWHLPRREAVAADRRASLGGPLHNKLALVWRNCIRKSSITSRDGRI
jgi:hypothetical protein